LKDKILKELLNIENMAKFFNIHFKSITTKSRSSFELYKFSHSNKLSSINK